MRTNVKSLQLYLPAVFAHQINETGLLASISENMISQKPVSHWQSQFCHQVGYSGEALPETQIRVSQLNLTSIKSASCCDPVMMQLTHRGAYMMGQDPLQLSVVDSKKIVDQINKRLMNPGEKIYWLDSNQWLFTSEKNCSLVAPGIDELIGKDMFNFSYSGEDGRYFQQLATEIQMLIKQMIDYQGLLATPPETMMNIHFHDQKNLTEIGKLAELNQNNLVIYTDSSMIRTFCQKSSLKCFDLELSDIAESLNGVVISFEKEQKKYAGLVEYWTTQALNGDGKSYEIICKDLTIQYKPKTSLWKRLFNW